MLSVNGQVPHPDWPIGGRGSEDLDKDLKQPGFSTYSKGLFMLGKALRLLRLFYDLSQTEVARRLGVNKSWISEIEAGNKSPTLELLQKYSDLFDIPVSSIMFFSESLQQKDRGRKVRSFVSKKILSLMEFIAERAGREDEQEVSP